MTRFTIEDMERFCERAWGADYGRHWQSADAALLDACVAALEAEVKKPAPDQSKLRMLLNDVRNAMSGAAGNIIASGILLKISALFGG